MQSKPLQNRAWEEFMGDHCLLLEFTTAGTMSPIGAILNPIHRKKMRDEKIWFNIHMTKEDRHVLYQARAIRRAFFLLFSKLTKSTVVFFTYTGH